MLIPTGFLKWETWPEKAKITAALFVNGGTAHAGLHDEENKSGENKTGYFRKLFKCFGFIRGM